MITDRDREQKFRAWIAAKRRGENPPVPPPSGPPSRDYAAESKAHISDKLRGIGWRPASEIAAELAVAQAAKDAARVFPVGSEEALRAHIHDLLAAAGYYQQAPQPAAGADEADEEYSEATAEAAWTMLSPLTQAAIRAGDQKAIAVWQGVAAKIEADAGEDLNSPSENEAWAMLPEVLQQRALAGDEAALSTWRQVATSIRTGVPLDEIDQEEDDEDEDG